MNKYQEALNKIKTEFWEWYGWEHCEEETNILQELIDEHQQLKEENQKLKKENQKLKETVDDKATPKKLKNKTDKDGRLLLVCPTCGDVYMKFWSDVETVSCRKYCDECGQKLDWSDE